MERQLGGWNKDLQANPTMKKLAHISGLGKDLYQT